MNWSEFFAMGNYGLYVWGSYGAAALVLVFNVLSARRRMQNVRRELQTLTHLNRAELGKASLHKNSHYQK